MKAPKLAFRAMRLDFLLALVALAAVAAPAFAQVYDDETRLVGCLALLAPPGVVVSFNCGWQASFAAAQPPGGQYRMITTWHAANPEWTNLHADLMTCKGACGPGSQVCLNGDCLGSGGSGVVQSASVEGPSPLSLAVSTSGDEDHVAFALRPVGPAFASLNSQSIGNVLVSVP